MGNSRQRARRIGWMAIWGLLIISLWGRNPVDSVAAETQESTPKTIYVVYDNSQSMLNSDAWCQAAYAIETLAALMDSEDTMYLYLMSDSAPYYSESVYSVQEKGSVENIRGEVHELLKDIGYTRYTHKDGLYKAIADIKGSTAENKWLLIFSDGEFNCYEGGISNDTIKLSNEVGKDVKTIYYKMGAEENRIEGADSYFTSEKSGSDILKTFTEISNLIYDRQIVDYTRNGNQISFTLGLPVERLIVTAQSQNGEISDEEIKLSPQATIQDMGISFQSLKSSEAKNISDEKQECNYYAAVKVYNADSPIPMGTYTVQVPDNSTITVYAEYEVQYTIALTRVSDGEVWILGELNEQEVPREGEYLVEVKLVNVMDGKVLQESSLYDKLEQDLAIWQDGKSTLITGRQQILMTEGECTIEGTATLEGNYPTELSFSISVGHQLGELELEAEVPEAGFDLDQIKAGEAVFSVRLLENGESITGCDNLILSAAVKESSSEQDNSNFIDSKYYICQVEDAQGQWNAKLLLSEEAEIEESMLQDCVLQLTVIGEKDGQKVECSKDIMLSFYASSYNISFQSEMSSISDVWDLFWHNQFTLTPIINGETINEKEWVGQIDYHVELEEQGDNPEVVVSQSSRNPLELSIGFDRGSVLKFWKLRDGGSMSGTLYLSMNRYGQNCTGSYPFEIILEPMSQGRRIMILLGMGLILYLIWLVIFKWILGCNFWGIPVYVKYEVRYGAYVLTGRLKPRRWFHRYIGRPFSSAVVIPLKKLRFLEFSPKVPGKLVIKRKLGDRYFIANIHAFAENEFVYKKGSPMKEEERFLDLEDGLNLTLMGEHPVELKIYTEEV